MGLALNPQVDRIDTPSVRGYSSVDDINPLHYLKDPKLWELWYIPYYA